MKLGKMVLQVAIAHTMVIGTVTTAFSQDGGRDDEIVKSECFIDAPLRIEGVYFERQSQSQDGNWAYYVAKYQHSYIDRKEILLVHYNDRGDPVLQRDITKNTPVRVQFQTQRTFPAYRHTGYPESVENYRPTANALVQQWYKSEVAVRASMQCQ